MELSGPRLYGLAERAAAYRKVRAISPMRRRELRESAGFSKKELAERIGVTVAQLSNFELGAMPKDDDIVRYYAVLVSLTAPEEPKQALTAQEREKLREYFDAEETCKHCLGIHTRACPRVKKMTYDGTTGALTSVEFWRDDEWPKDHVIFRDSPEMYPAEEE